MPLSPRVETPRLGHPLTPRVNALGYNAPIQKAKQFKPIGINTAPKIRQSAPGTADANKQTKESNSMLNKFNKKRGGFTLVEIMIVVAIIALLAAIAVPGFLRARKRSQASRVINDLRLIDAAVDQYAIETNRTTGFVLNTADWTNYLKKGSALYNSGKDLFGDELRSAISRFAAGCADEHVQHLVGRCRFRLLLSVSDPVVVICDSSTCHLGRVPGWQAMSQR